MRGEHDDSLVADLWPGKRPHPYRVAVFPRQAHLPVRGDRRLPVQEMRVKAKHPVVCSPGEGGGVERFLRRNLNAECCARAPRVFRQARLEGGRQHDTRLITLASSTTSQAPSTARRGPREPLVRRHAVLEGPAQRLHPIGPRIRRRRTPARQSVPWAGAGRKPATVARQVPQGATRVARLARSDR